MKTQIGVLGTAVLMSTMALADEARLNATAFELGYLNYDYPRQPAVEQSRETGYTNSIDRYEPGYLNSKYPSDRNGRTKSAVSGKILTSGISNQAT